MEPSRSALSSGNNNNLTDPHPPQSEPAQTAQDGVIKQLAELHLNQEAVPNGPVQNTKSTPVNKPSNPKTDRWISELIEDAKETRNGGGYRCTLSNKLVPECLKSVAPQLYAAVRKLSVLYTGQQKIEPGCSILINVFYDYFESFKNSSSSKSHNKPNKVQRDEIHLFIKNMRHINAMLLFVALGSGTWEQPILEKDTTEQLPLVQKASLEALNTVILGLSLSDQSYAQEDRLNACILLRDILTLDYRLLFYPLDPIPIIDQQFLRIYYRIDSADAQIDQLVELSNACSAKSKVPIYARFKVYAQLFKDYCQRLKPTLRNLAFAKEPKLDDLKNFYSHLLSFGLSWLDSLHRDMKSFEKSEHWTKQNQSEFSQLIMFLHGIADVTYSIEAEGLIAILQQLLLASAVGVEELENCFKNLINGCTKLSSVLSDKSIKDKIQNSKQENGPTDAQELTEILESFFKRDLEDLNERFLASLIELLDVRTRRAKESQDVAVMERLLTLRDATLKINRTLQKSSEEITTSLEEFRKLHERFPNLTDGTLPNHQILHIELQRVAEVSLEVMRAAKEGVEAMIGRCFNAGHNNLEKAAVQRQEEAAQKQLEADKHLNELLVELHPYKEPPFHPPKPQKTKVSPETEKKPTPVKKKVVVPKVHIEKSKLPHPLASITSIHKSIESIQNIPVQQEPEKPFRTTWRNAQVSNLKDLLTQLSETVNEAKFKSDLIFGQTDLCRKIIETALEIVLSHYPVTQQGSSSLHLVTDAGHQLHKLVRLLLQASSVLPDNVSNALWELRGIPYQLSQANRCVNYLYTTASQHNLSPQAGELVRYLLSVERQTKPGASEKVQDMLLDKHKELVGKSLYFVQTLLESMADPKKSASASACTVPELTTLTLTLDDESPEEFATLHESAKFTALPLGIENVKIEEIEKLQTLTKIVNRKDALGVINRALGWIAARSMGPVNGYIGAIERKDKRNEALENVALYLTRLRDKLAASRSTRPYDTVYGELSLIRRAHKELIIAALYHGQHYMDGQHIIEKEQLRYENSPHCLMHFLQKVLPDTHLPELPTWLHSVHSALSYPTPIQQEQRPFEETKLRTLLNDLRTQVTLSKNASPGFILIGPNSKTIDANEILSTTKRLILQIETEKVFPALTMLMQTLQATLWTTKGNIFT